MSAKKAKKKKVKQNINPKDQHIKQGADPESYSKKTPIWNFELRDKDHPRWGWSRLSMEEFFEKIYDKKLFSFQTMTWAEIEQQAGGRRHGTNSHELSVADDLCKEAKTRLRDLDIEADTVFSLRLQGTHRIYGIRDNRVLRIIWFDEEHEICPISR